MPIPALVGAAAIGGLTGLINTGLQGRQSRRNAERTARANMELAQYQYSKDLEMWNLQNQYNDPRNQMSRFKSAGLNPNLIYGQGNAGNAQAMPKFEAPRVDYNQITPMQIPEVLGQYNNLRMQQAQIDNVKAQTQNTQERTLNEALQRIILEVSGQRGKFDLEKAKALLPYDLSVRERESAIKQEEVIQAIQRSGMFRSDARIKQQIARRLEGTTASDIERAGAEALFSKYRAHWMKQGVTSSDHLVVRLMARLLDEQGIGLDSLLQE